MNDVYLLTGSNIGERLEMLAAVVKKLAGFIGKPVAMSAVYETEPWGMADARPFLNQALHYRTDLTPGRLLSAILRTELVLGRVRMPGSKWESRLIDIDILLYGDRIISNSHLTIPHPLMHERRFALLPMCEIAPALLHPVMGITLQDLLEQCPDQCWVNRYEPALFQR